MVKEISVSVGRTINLGNYQSLRVEVSATATIDRHIGETEDEARALVSQWLKRQVNKTIEEQQGKDS